MGRDNNTERGTVKKEYNKISVFIGFAVFLATVIVIAFFMPGKHTDNIADLQAAPSPSSQPSVSYEPPAQNSPGNTESPEEPARETVEFTAAPFIYEKDADIFIASGKNKIRLGSRQSLYGCYKEINCALSNDNRYLYYIEDTDINTGTGTLKSVSADAASSPVTIEDGVCAAEISPDGSIMYIKNIRGIAGELYLFKDGESSFVDNNVLPVFMKFSQGGSCMSYIVQQSAGVFALYVKRNGGEPMQVTRVTAEAAMNGGIYLSRFNDIVPFDSGQVLYSMEENYNTPLYVYNPDGKTERVCNDGYIIKTYPNGDFFYADIAKNNLWYKSPGADAVNITENYSYSRFPEDPGRFLLMEHNGDGFEDSSVMMYEINVMMYEIDESKGKKVISLGDNKIFEINSTFDYVAYERAGVLCVSRKTDTGWKETKLPETSEDDVGVGSQSNIVARFDGQGDNLYFFNEYKCGSLYMYSLKEKKTVKLLDNVDRLYVFKRIAYAHVTSDKLYRIEGSEAVKISEGVHDVKETQGGAFFLADGSYEFIPEDPQNAQPLDSFTRAAGTTGSIEFRPPLEEDLNKALEVLSGEANYCLYKLGIRKSKVEEFINISDALKIAQKLAGRNDISETERKILEYFAEGFKAYEGDNRSKAKVPLKKAVEMYSEYMESAGNEEER